MAEHPSSPPKKLEVKKYPNRRYYDTTHSRHLTLDEIRSLIQQGYDLTATDARTGADITALVLTQIILELETAKLDSFPVPLLLRLIRMNDRLTKDFIEKYFNQALASFLEYQQQMENQIRKAQGLPTSIPSVAAWTRAMLGPFAPAAGPEAGTPPAPPPASGDSENRSELRAVVRDLQAQVAELKAGLKTAPARKPRRRGRTRSK